MPKAAVKAPISVIERRLKSGSMFAAGSKAIPLKEPLKWEVRVVNTTISDDRLWQMQAEKGWIYLDVADLAVEPHEIGFRVLESRVVRGQHGQEVVMKMLKKDYQKIQRLKDQENRTHTFSQAATKQAILSAASGELGDQGASFLQNAVKRIDVVDSKELTSLEE